MDDDERLTLTPEEAEQISHLTKQLGAKFGEIMQELANQYGLGGVVETDPDGPQIRWLKREAEEAAENWEEADAQPCPPTPTTPLQKLLAEHHELGEQILDIQEEATERQVGSDDDDEA